MRKFIAVRDGANAQDRWGLACVFDAFQVSYIWLPLNVSRVTCLFDDFVVCDDRATLSVTAHCQ